MLDCARSCAVDLERSPRRRLIGVGRSALYWGYFRCRTCEPGITDLAPSANGEAYVGVDS